MDWNVEVGGDLDFEISDGGGGAGDWEALDAVAALDSDDHR